VLTSNLLAMPVTRGAARVDGDEVKPVDTPPIDVHRIEEVGNNVWLFSDRDVWEVASNLECKRIMIENPFSPGRSKSTSKESWITGLGAEIYKVTRGDPWSTVTSVVDISDVEMEGEKCWLAGKQGLQEVVNGQVIHHYLQGQNVRILKFWNKALWVSTKNNIYCLTKGTLKRKLTIKPPTHFIAIENANNLWLMSDHRNFWIDSSNKIHKCPEELEGQFAFANSGNLVYLLHYSNRNYIFKNGHISKMPEIEDLNMIYFNKNDKSPWIFGDDALWRLENGTAKKVCTEAEWGFAISEGSQGPWVIGEDYLIKIENGNCRRLPDRKIRVMDMVQTPASAWVITIDGDLLRIKDDKVETLTVPLPQTLIEDRPSEKTLRFLGKVREVTLKEDKPDSISFKVNIDLEFKNGSDMSVYIVDGSPVMKDWKYLVSGNTLAYSPDAAKKKDYLFEDPGMWPSILRGPDYLAFRDCLDIPAPSGKCLRLLAPGESYRFTDRIFLSMDKNWNSPRFPSIVKRWEEIAPSKPLWLQVNVESWPINLGYCYSMNVSVPT
jgi:hypothetical protein